MADAPPTQCNECRSLDDCKHRGRERTDNRASGWQRYGPTYRANRLIVIARASPWCPRCSILYGSGRATITADHIVPRSLGGSDDLVNLVDCCKGCNSARGARPMPDRAALSDWI